MSVRKFSTASILSPSYKNSKIWDGETFPGYFESIQTVVVSSAGQATVTFSNIPQNYAHLQIRAITRDNVSAYVGETYLTFNGSGSNYDSHFLQGQGQSVSAGRQNYSTVIRIGQTPGVNALSNVFSSFVVDILDYSNTNKNKTVKVLNGYENNGNGSGQDAGFIYFGSGLWMDTNAVNSITIRTNGTLQQNSQFALYGIRSA